MIFKIQYPLCKCFLVFNAVVDAEQSKKTTAKEIFSMYISMIIMLYQTVWLYCLVGFPSKGETRC